MERKTYTDVEKLAIVREVEYGHKSVAQAARDNGVNKASVHNWLAKYRNSKLPSPSYAPLPSSLNVLAMVEMIHRLEYRLDEMEREREQLRADLETFQKFANLFRPSQTK